MLITGYIEEIIPFSYQNNGKTYHKNHIVISYPFYNLENKIVLTANNQIELPTNLDQQYVFSFDAVTRYAHEKLFTDFYVHKIHNALKVTEEAYLTIVDTKVRFTAIELIKEEEIKGRIKKTVVLHLEDQSDLHVFYWEDNPYVQDIAAVNTLQLNGRSMYHKNRWINNLEIWRTIEKDDFLGSIIL